MTASVAKLTFVLLAVGWYAIRFEHARRSRRVAVRRDSRDSRENALLLISLSGLGILPLLYVATAFPRFADYTFRPAQAWIGVLFAVAALLLFQMTHRALGRNWSVTLQLRQDHKLITSGIYRKIRHPMYTAFWLWAVAQACLLPNWFAGFAGLVGFGVLFIGRIGREERMMLETFGDDYREYMSKTYRIIPLIF
ncbi:protein-S-isoprenylcysteine O-methyltransferase [Bradyrhizobium sp.]|uniref:protein-S-isoprenylcysteine O-methyltransferase n=1 Tax=Bradyrhizobium sp. TaxID=376 RepID=UPI003C71F97D